MNEFFLKPNLPDRQVRLAICGKHNENITQFIESQGIELLYPEDNLLLDKPLRNHADLSVHHLGGENIIIEETQNELYKILFDLGMNVSKTKVSSPYPYDCSINCFVTDKYLFCNKKIIDISIIRYKEAVEIIDIKQGYTKCSTLLLNDNSLITDDISIYNKATDLSFNCILISKGDILLEGYNYGFIGGASAKISEDTVLFFGDITKHRDYKLIDEFIKGLGMKYIYSKDFPLTDIGGLIPLK